MADAAPHSPFTFQHSSSFLKPSCCRKHNSLALLCSNFLSLYNRDGVLSISLDDAASRLGVQRRRIYDIVNVLESVGILARRAKNQYSWKGFSAIPIALQELKEEGLKENLCALDAIENSKVGEEDDTERSNLASGIQKSSTPLRNVAENRREKTLALLTRNFVKLFVCSNADVISLDEAARLLLGDSLGASLMRTKIRRLYDIANVLSSIRLIEKMNSAAASATRRPAFRWIGLRDEKQNKNNCVSNLIPRNSNERQFGADVTNIHSNSNSNSISKRNSSEISLHSHNNSNIMIQNKCAKLDDGGTPNSKHFKFGPFALDVGPSSNLKQRVRNWESIASTLQPHYRNQALRELFSHYMEAWRSWYSQTSV